MQGLKKFNFKLKQLKPCEMALQSVGNFLTTQAIKGARNGMVRYGPVAAAAGEAFLRAADASRQFVRDAAISSEDPLTEEEYRVLEGNNTEICVIGSEIIVAEAETKGSQGRPKSSQEARKIRVCCQTIRASRERLKSTGFGRPIPLFSHWSLEVSSSQSSAGKLGRHVPD